MYNKISCSEANNEENCLYCPVIKAANFGAENGRSCLTAHRNVHENEEQNKEPSGALL
jgi:aspartyl/asparaginyl beta-hydroxylase (cupin superfamily)